MNVGAILGILLGGLITTYLSWRYIFLINVPIGLAAVIVAWFVLEEHGNKQARSLDWWGMILLGLGLFLVLLTMVHSTSQAFTWRLGLMFVLGIVSLTLFVIGETYQTHPMMKLDLFKNRIVSASLLAAFFQATGNFAVLFLVIMYLQGLRQPTPLNASLLLVPGYLVGGVLGPVSGHLADKFGSALPATVGLGIEAVALFFYAHLGLHTPLWAVIVISTLNGIGNAGFFPANNAAVMKGGQGDPMGLHRACLEHVFRTLRYAG